jgi:hypothetical protein
MLMRDLPLTGDLAKAAMSFSARRPLLWEICVDDNTLIDGAID